MTVLPGVCEFRFGSLILQYFSFVHILPSCQHTFGYDSSIMEAEVISGV